MQLRPASLSLFSLTSPAFQGRRQTDGERHRGRARPTPGLLAAAEELRRKPDPLADQKQPDPRRAVELVGAGGQRGHAQGVEIDRDSPDGLHGVGVDGNPAIVGEPRQFGDRLDRAGLVVGEHQGRQTGTGTDRLRHRMGVGPSLGINPRPIDGETFLFEPPHGLGDGRMLDRARNDPRPN